jgi:hypothetical protein
MRMLLTLACLIVLAGQGRADEGTQYVLNPDGSVRAIEKRLTANESKTTVLEQRVAELERQLAEARSKQCRCGPVCPKGGACDPCDCVFGYAEACARVGRGERVTLYVGLPAQPGCGQVDALAGFSAGVYDCWREEPDGQHLMQPRASVAPVPGATAGFTVIPAFGGCPGGRCPAQR